MRSPWRRWAKALAILTVAASVGVAGAISDGIGSIPIVVRHLLRLVVGRDHRFLLPAAGLLGALMRRNSDRMVRAIGTPAERPSGIGTSIVCGPVFLRILLRRRDRVDPRC